MVLSLEHADQLRKSGVSDDIANERGYFTSRRRAEQVRLGFSRPQTSESCLVIPLWDVRGERRLHVLRPDSPRVVEGKPRKYEWPSRTSPILDVHPKLAFALRDPAVPLVVTEGIKKGDAAASRGILAIALSGVWNWRGSNDLGGTLALSDWDEVALKNREVLVAFDSDAATKRPVADALSRLHAFLEGRGARARVVYLPTREDGSKVGLDDYLVEHPEVRGVHALAELAVDKVVLPARKVMDGPPEILVGLDLHRVVDTAQDALCAQGTIFQRSGVLVHVVAAEPKAGANLLRAEGAKVIKLLESARIHELAGVAAKFVNDEGEQVPVPHALANTLMARGAWTFPVLRGVVTSPTLRQDGSIVTAPGYDAQTQLYAAFDPQDFEPVPDRPTLEDARAAFQVLREPFVDFPFVTEHKAAAEAGAVAAVLTVIGRHVIDGPIPLFLVGSSTPGVGKSLLASVVGAMSTGLVPAAMAVSDDPEEVRKVLLSVALAGDRVAVLDNIVGGFGCGPLAAAVTSREVRGRILGRSEMLSARFEALIIATGNNVALRGDLGRRVLPIELEALTEQPENRTGFRHEELLTFVKANLPKFITAALTVLRAHMLEGRPQRAGLPRYGSFEAWDQVIRHALLWVTGVDVLDVRTSMRETVDEDVAGIAAVHEALASAFPSGVVVSELVRRVSPGFDTDYDLAAALGAIVPSGKLSGHTIGKALSGIRNRLVSGRRLVAQSAGGHRKLWRVEQVAQQGEFSESSESVSQRTRDQKNLLSPSTTGTGWNQTHSTHNTHPDTEEEEEREPSFRDARVYAPHIAVPGSLQVATPLQPNSYGPSRAIDTRNSEDAVVAPKSPQSPVVAGLSRRCGLERGGTRGEGEDETLGDEDVEDVLGRLSAPQEGGK